MKGTQIMRLPQHNKQTMETLKGKISQIKDTIMTGDMSRPKGTS
jgi:hypothetical protein